MGLDDLINPRWNPKEEDTRQVTTKRDGKDRLLVNHPRHRGEIRIVNENECPEEGKIKIEIIETGWIEDPDADNLLNIKGKYAKARYIGRPEDDTAEKRQEVINEENPVGDKNDLITGGHF